VSLGKVFDNDTGARLHWRRPPYADAVFAIPRRRVVAPR